MVNQGTGVCEGMLVIAALTWIALGEDSADGDTALLSRATKAGSRGIVEALMEQKDVSDDVRASADASLVAVRASRFDLAEAIAKRCPDVLDCLAHLGQALALWKDLRGGGGAGGAACSAKKRKSKEAKLKQYKDLILAESRDDDGRESKEANGLEGRVNEELERLEYCPICFESMKVRISESQ